MALNDDGTVTFTPDADLCGDDAAGFDYTVEDGNGGSDTGHVTVDLTCVNDAPFADNDAATIAQASGPADHDVLANDTDTEGDALSITGTLVVSPVNAGVAAEHNGMLQFTPASNFHGTVVITYTADDGNGGTDHATLTITVTPESTPPVAVAPGVAFSQGRVDQSVPLRVTWSASDNLSGIVSYQLQVSVGGGPFTNVYTGTATSHTKFYPLRKTLVWRVRATDGAGNVSAWASSRRRINTIQNSSHHMSYTGKWKGVAEPRSSGAGYIYTQAAGNKAMTTFTGRAVLYVATKMKTGAPRQALRRRAHGRPLQPARQDHDLRQDDRGPRVGLERPAPHPGRQRRLRQEGDLRHLPDHEVAPPSLRESSTPPAPPAASLRLRTSRVPRPGAIGRRSPGTRAATMPARAPGPYRSPTEEPA